MSTDRPDESASIEQATPAAECDPTIVGSHSADRIELTQPRDREYIDLATDDGTAPYSAILSSLYTDHLRDSGSNAPTVVSTFCGCGGSSLGYSAAGFRELAAVDYDPRPIVTFSRNFTAPVLKGDMRAIDMTQLREYCGVEPGELDLLDGSPPCQGFSAAGNNDPNDERNSLFLEYIRCIEAFQPKTFSMENVTGMVQGKMKPVFAAILHELRHADPGYTVTAKRIAARRLGAPTKRERMIFVGVRSDLVTNHDVTPAHPQPQTRVRTLRDGFEDLPTGHADGLPNLAREGDRYGKLWPRIPVGKSAADVIGAGALARKHDPEKPCYSINTMHTNRGYGSNMHWAQPRVFSARETARVQSFPDEFSFPSKYSDAMYVIGNAVPPLLSYHVGRTIRDEILAELPATEPCNS